MHIQKQKTAQVQRSRYSYRHDTVDKLNRVVTARLVFRLAVHNKSACSRGIWTGIWPIRYRSPQ